MDILLPASLMLIVLVAFMAMALRLCRPADRITIAAWMLVGFFATLVKIWLFSQAPQIGMGYPDSIVYQLHGLALSQHWSGVSVDASAFLLGGLEAKGIGTWENDVLSYAAVFGSREWLYPGYIAVWYWMMGDSPALMVYSLRAIAAVLPAAAFGIALLLGASRRVAFVAGGIALLDPSIGAVAASMLKDTLASSLMMLTIWAALAFIVDKRREALVWLCFALGALTAVRFVAYVAIGAGLGVVLIFNLWQKQLKRGGSILLVLALSTIIQIALDQAPTGISLAQWYNSMASPYQGQVGTFSRQPGEVGADEAVLRWKEELKRNPTLAIVKSVPHSLFAPYPWLAIWPGLTWRKINELYYPGMVLWIMCLPGILYSLIGIRKQKDRLPWVFVATVLLFLLVIYTTFFGEWSTRQRVFALPVFFALAAIGWDRIALKLRGSPPPPKPDE